MRQAMRQPIMGQGIIPGKALLDLALIRDRMQASDDPALSANCVPGGNREINHDAMPGDLSFGLRMVRNPAGMYGASNEWGTASFAGEFLGDYKKKAAWIGQYYLQGVIATESRLSDPNDSNTPDPGHGYALIKAGSTSIVNNGPDVIYPGDWVCYDFPDFDANTYREPANRINERARAGEPATKFRGHVKRFEPEDGVKLHVELSKELIITGAASGGISDIDMMKFFDYTGLRDVPVLSNEQQEAAGHKYGTAAIAFAYIQTLIGTGLLFTETDLRAAFDKGVTTGGTGATGTALVDAVNSFLDTTKRNGPANAPGYATSLADTIGIFKTQESDQTIVRECIKNCFEYKPLAGTNPNYDRLRSNTSKFLHECIVSGWYRRTQTIFARSFNFAAPSDTLHLVVNYGLI